MPSLFSAIKIYLVQKYAIHAIKTELKIYDTKLYFMYSTNSTDKYDRTKYD
jgi:hypothetical protein